MGEVSVGPDPSHAGDIAEYIRLLGQLRVQAGTPSFRTLARRVGPLMRPPRTVSQSTIGDVFQPRRRRLDIDLVAAVVRALGADERDVARWRQTCVAVHAAAKSGGSIGVFRQLPADLATFTGREEDLGQLIKEASASRSAEGARTVVISAIQGMAGVGKTQLALHAAHELVRSGRFADIQLYVNLRGFDPDQPPADPGAVLDAFLRQLEVPAQQIPVGLDERAAMFRDRMHGRDALVLLDNARDEDQVRDLIPAGDTCLVLVTSRRILAGLDGAHVHALDVFSESEALELMSRIAGPDRVAAEPEASRQVAATCGYLPLAIALAASRLRSRRAWSVADLAGRLLADGLDRLNAGDRSLRRIFDVSYQALPVQAQSMFRMLGLWTGKDIELHAAAALFGCTDLQAERLLETLVDAHLLQSPSPDRYQFHDLLRVYARELAHADERPADRNRAVARMLTWYLHACAAAMDCIAPQRRPITLHSNWSGPALLPTFDTVLTTVAWCDAERANLVAATALALEHNLNDIAWQLPTSLQYYFHTNMRIDDFITSHLTGLKAARRIESVEGESRLSHGLAAAYRILGRFDEAIELGRRLPTLYRRVGDVRGEAAALSSLAQTYQQSGNSLSAVDLFLRSSEIIRLLDGQPLAPELNNLGIAYQSLHKYDEANACFEEALRISIDRGDLATQGYVLSSLGTLSAELSNHRQAIGFFEQAIRLHDAIGSKVYQAEDLERLSRSQRALGNLQEAVGTLSQAQKTFSERERPNGAALSRRPTPSVRAGEQSA